ncbi:hypothetical protein hmeg3_22210 [Herbaspirillum sp. meg3]|nr:hypothetical protein hmeg3_22210 [Herbaspirillum sp. meg3]
MGVVVLLLAGCAAKSVQRNVVLDSSSGKGLVVISVSHDRVGSRGMVGTFYMDRKNGLSDMTMLRTLGEAFPGVVKGSQFKDSYGQVLVLELAAGKHSMDSWRAARQAGYEITPSVDPSPLEFEVVAGSIQYLGNLHLNMESGKNAVGLTVIADAYPEVRDMRARDIALVEKIYPQFKDSISINLLPLGPWSAERGNTRFISPLFYPVTK